MVATSTLDLLAGGDDAVIVALRSTSPTPGPGDTRVAAWSTEELLRWWRTRNYRDPAGLATITLDWDDDVERVAIAAHFLTWNTPEAVASMVGTPTSRSAMADVWAAIRPPERQLLRRRAAILIAVYLGITL
jgi:hypothetical protein